MIKKIPFPWHSPMATLTHNTHLHPSPTSPIPSNPTAENVTVVKPTSFEPKPAFKFQSLKEIRKRGNLKEAFHSFSDAFTAQGFTHFSPDEAYASMIELCASQKALSQGRQIHAHLITSGAEFDSVFLSTKLVLMYGKCGSLRDAEVMFDDMPQRTIFSWNAMASAYVSNGKPSEALELYYDLRSSEVTLDAYTFPCVLKACGLLVEARQGAEIHGYIIKSGFDSYGFVVNAILSMYVKCDDIEGARQLFDRITEREDAVLWNSIILGYSAGGRPLEALMLFKEMYTAAIDTSTYTLVAALRACEDQSFWRSGTEIHAFALKSGYDTDVYVANALVIMYARCNRVKEAGKVFGRMVRKDSISWNSMLTGLVQNGHFRKALMFSHEMQKAKEKPDPVSLIGILSASGQLEYLMNGMEAHAFSIKNGLDLDLHVANTVMGMYAKCHHVNYMGCVFRGMPHRDPVSWTTAVAGYAQNGYYVRALKVFREAQGHGIPVDVMMIGSVVLACTGTKCMNHAKEIHGYVLKNQMCDLVMSNTLVDLYGECSNIDYASRVFDRIVGKDVVSWTSMISAYVGNGMGNEALTFFSAMQESGIELDSVAVVSLLTAAASLSLLKKGKEIHGFLLRKGFSLEGSIASCLVDTYARCGRLEDAYHIFRGFEVKDVVAWTSMINAAGMHGRGVWAVELFSEMENEDVYPDHVTFLALLYACSHSGLADQGRRFLDIMRWEYKLEPWPEHYTCVVDLLGRADRLNEAYELVKGMPADPNAAAWCSLLGACHVHGNKELGKVAAQELLNLEPENPGNYVLISNVFAATGRWGEVDRVRNRMQEKGLKKNPGCSWIEVQNKVHTFVASDRSHVRSKEIYLKLAEITEVLEREGGYVPQTKYVLHNVEEEKKVKLLHRHSERLAIAYGLLETCHGTPIRVTKNLRICGDCHVFMELVSRYFYREIVVRDASRFHHFSHGTCSCGDLW